LLAEVREKVSHGCTSFGARHQYLDVWHQFGGDDYAPIRKVSYRPTACPNAGMANASDRADLLAYLLKATK